MCEKSYLFAVAFTTFLTNNKKNKQTQSANSNEDGKRKRRSQLLIRATRFLVIAVVIDWFTDTHLHDSEKCIFSCQFMKKKHAQRQLKSVFRRSSFFAHPSLGLSVWATWLHKHIRVLWFQCQLYKITFGNVKNTNSVPTLDIVPEHKRAATTTIQATKK